MPSDEGRQIAFTRIANMHNLLGSCMVLCYSKLQGCSSPSHSAADFGDFSIHLVNNTPSRQIQLFFQI